MYLSKIKLAHSDETIAMLLNMGGNSFYTHHQVIWKAFSVDGKAGERDFVFKAAGGVLPTYYVLSKTEPRATSVLNVESKEIDLCFKAGRTLQFTLRANPTMKVRTEDDPKGRHYSVMTVARQNDECPDEAAIKWLTKRGEQWGVEFNTVAVNDSQREQAKKGQRTVTFDRVDYVGTLTVTNPEMFAERLMLGFGRARSFGCGLMLVK